MKKFGICQEFNTLKAISIKNKTFLFLCKTRRLLFLCDTNVNESKKNWEENFNII